MVVRKMSQVKIGNIGRLKINNLVWAWGCSEVLWARLVPNDVKFNDKCKEWTSEKGLPICLKKQL